MATFDLPDHANAAFDAQARLFSADLKAITQTASLTGVKNGCLVTAQASPNMTVAVSAGVCYFLNAEVAVTAGNVTITAANATNPRIDIVVVSSGGSKSAVAGTPAEFPLEPATPANSIMLAQVYVPANDTAIGATQIKDRGITLQIPSVIGASTIVRKTADESVTSSTTLQNDDQLFFTMTSNTAYQFKLVVLVATAFTSNTGIKFGFYGPAGVVYELLVSGRAVAATGVSSDGARLTATTLAIQTTGADTFVIEGTVVSTGTSGNFGLTWAQNSPSATSMRVLMNSYLEYRAMA